MKKYCLILVLILFNNALAQPEFKARKYQFISENNVFEIENKKADQLYLDTKKWIAKTYKRPEMVTIGDVENNLLKVSSVFVIPSKGMMGKTFLEVNYHLQLEFKNEKVRILINSLKGQEKTSYSMFFKKNGEPRETKEVHRFLEDINEYVNAFIQVFLDDLSGIDDW